MKFYLNAKSKINEEVVASAFNKFGEVVSNVADCDLLGEIEIRLDGKMKKGEKLNITLSIDNNGILQVKVVNQKLGIHVESKIRRETDISEEEIKKAYEEIEEFYLG